MSSDIFGGRIFFLGAGFSAGAGIPLTKELLPKAARLFRAEAPGLFSRVENYADQVDVNLSGTPDAEDFAKVCTHIEFIELREFAGGERWSNRGSREKLALQFFLAKAIALATPPAAEIPKHYLDFARDLTPNDIVVTFNWDLLLELSLDAVNIPYCHSFEEGKVHIVKLHGSLNWIDGEPRSLSVRRRSFDYRPLGLREGLMENELFYSNLLKDKNKWLHANCLVDEVQPFLVLPGFGKAFDIRVLASLWYRIEFLNIRSGGVSIIGLNVSEDDFIVASLFRYLLRGVFPDDRRIYVLNPALEVEDRFRQLGGSNAFHFDKDYFSEETLNRALLK